MLIAEFCTTQQPALWTPVPGEIRERQGLIRRLEAPHDMIISRSIRACGTQRDLLTSILGSGEKTAAVLLAELFDKRYASARQAAASAGSGPRIVESGT